MARRRTGSGSPPPLPTGDEKTARVRAMFDTIAPRYDLINRMMTFGLDQAWRRGTVAALALPEGARVLDLACGTGDLSRLALRRGYRVIGADLSAGMLGANGAATPLVEADGSRLPFVDGARIGGCSRADEVVDGLGRNWNSAGTAPPRDARLKERQTWDILVRHLGDQKTDGFLADLIASRRHRRKSWRIPRRVIVRAHCHDGDIPRSAPLR